MMIKAIILGLVCVLASATPVNDIDKYVAPKTIIARETPLVTKYLSHAHRASLNFACNVERITVTPNFENFDFKIEDPVSQVELEDHLGEVTNIEWAHVLQSSFGSTDPRGQERQLGTLGGDLGEFLLVLNAIEKETNQNFTDAQVLQRFKRYLTVMSKDKFYFDIDLDAIANLKKACNCPQLNIADPPDSKKPVLRNSTHEAASQGNDLFKRLLQDPEKFQVRKELVIAVIDSFFEVMWQKADPLHRRIRFVLLKGPLAPKGFIIVKTPGYCNAQLLAPLISPELCQKQMGMYHGDAAVLLRTEIAGVLLYKNPDDKNAVVLKANALSADWLKLVVDSTALPVYTVSFEQIA